MPNDTKNLATLVNPQTKKRVQVEVGSPQAQQFFGQGFVLEQQAPTKPATLVDPTGAQTPIQAQTPEQAQQAFAQGFVLPETLGEQLNVEVPPVIDSDILSSVRNQPVTRTEIQNLIERQRAKREELTGLLSPTVNEQQIQTELADVRQRANQLRQSFEEGLVDIEGQPIPMDFIVGQSRELEKRFNLKLSDLQRQEANLISRLGLEQELRQNNIDAAKLGLSFIADDIDLQLMLEDRIQEQEDRALEQVRRLSADAQNKLSIILSGLQGLSFDELPQQDQAQITAFAQQAGIPLSVLVNTLDVAKNQLDLERSLQQAKIGSQQALTSQRLGSGGLSGADFSKSQKLKLERAGLLDAPRQEQLEFLNPVSTSEIKRAFSQDIEAGVPLSELLTTLVLNGFDPFSSGFDFLTVKAIENEIERNIDNGMTESEIRENLRNSGLNDEEIDQFNDLINKAPNKFTRFVKGIFK